MSERRPQSHQTAQCSYGLLMPVYDCLWNDARGRNHGPVTFVSSSPAPDCSWLWAPALGTQFLRQEHAVFPSPLPENKSHHSVSSKFCLSGFHSASVGREGQVVGQQQKEVSQRKTNIVLQVEAVYSYRWTNLQNRLKCRKPIYKKMLVGRHQFRVWNRHIYTLIHIK